ncbi:MAG: glycosyltransferase [Halanaerobiales bacterium]
MSTKPSISLCMIVKDEEKNIKRCLESVYKYLDEIIIVDTGSSDNTIRIAKEYGAKILEEKWDDDFSKARNKSLEYATGEWILYLDADEYLPLKTAEGLRELVKDNTITAWIFSIISPINESGDVNKHINIRLFRNKKEYYFKGKIHEQIKASILKNNPEESIVNSNLEIYHTGYRIDLPNRREKTLRNIRILKKELSAKENDSFLNFNLAKSYYVLGMYQLSQKYYQKALDNIKQGCEFTPALYRNYAACLLASGEYNQALKLLKKGILDYQDYPDLYFLFGQIFWELGIIKEAKKYFNYCIQFKEINYQYTTTEGVNDFLAWENLGEVCLLENNYQQALKYFENAYQSKKSSHLLYKILNCLINLSQSDQELLNHFKNTLSKKLALSFAEIISLLYSSKNFAICLMYYQEEEKAFSSEEYIIIQAILFFIKKDNSLKKHLEKGLKKTNNSPFTIACYVVLSLLSKNDKNKRFAKEFEVYDNKIEINEAVIKVLKKIMVFLYSIEEKDLAIAIAKYINKFQNKNYYYILGRNLMKNNNYNSALFYFLHSLYLSPEDDNTYYYIAQIYEKENKFEKAFEYYHKARQINKDEKKYYIGAMITILKTREKYLHLSLNYKNNSEMMQKLVEVKSMEKKYENFRKELSYEKNTESVYDC